MCLEAMGFPNIFSTRSESENGSPSNFFKGARGLRQALMRALPIHLGYGNAQPKVIRGSSREQTYFIVKTTPQDPQVSHICYADDVLVFADCSIRNARSLNRLLDDFQTVSGLSINRAKCFITFSASGAGMKRGVL